MPPAPAPVILGIALLVAGACCPMRGSRSAAAHEEADRGARAVSRLVAWLGRQPWLPRLLLGHGVQRTLEADALIVGDGSRWLRVLGASGGETPATLRGRLAALRLLCLAAGSALGAATAVGLGVGAVPLGVALTGLGVTIPDAAVRAAATNARRRLDEALPGVLDLVAAACSAGLALDAALAVAAVQADDSLQAIVTRACSRQRTGEPLATALRREAERAAAPRVLGFAVVIERHHRLGRPLAGIAWRLADGERARRRSALRARAGRSVALGSLVVATVITPACVVALAALTLSGILASGVIQ